MNPQVSPQKDFGYQFYPSVSAHSPGHPRLDIHLFEVPTYHHFDPRTATFQIVDESEIKSLSVHHPWDGLGKYKVCASMVTIKDRNGKKVEAFTFGATLEIKTDQTFTNCDLQSAAPIIEIPKNVLAPFSTSAMVVEEVKILFSEIKAGYLSQKDDYENFILQFSPDVLYAACLNELKEKYQNDRYSEQAHFQEFRQFLNFEIQSLKDSQMWPLNVPPLIHN